MSRVYEPLNPTEAHELQPWVAHCDCCPIELKGTFKIKDLVKTTRGFHQADITESHADAMLRGQKTDFICSAGRNVQKGDYLVLSVYNKQFHDISEVVWEVTFVSAIAHSERSDGYGAVVLSLRRLPNTRFKKGYLGGEYLDDCIVEEG